MKFENTTKIEQIKTGKKVYYVYALGAASFYDEMVISSDEITNTMVNTNGGFGRFSLEDCNVIKNNYNDHKLFNDVYNAKKYVTYCIDNNIGERITNWYDDDACLWD